MDWNEAAAEIVVVAGLLCGDVPPLGLGGSCCMLRLDISARSWRVLAAALTTASVDLVNDPDGTPAGCGGGGGDANIPATNENE